jgi:hypothetical protein
LGRIGSGDGVGGRVRVEVDQEWGGTIWDQCYDFLKYFRQKMAILSQSTL